MIVADILKTKGGDVISVEGNDSILHALKIMKEKHIGAVLVMAGAGKIAGVLSERDIVRALPEQGGDLLKKSVSDLMTKDVCREQSQDMREHESANGDAQHPGHSAQAQVDIGLIYSVGIYYSSSIRPRSGRGPPGRIQAG